MEYLKDSRMVGIKNLAFRLNNIINYLYYFRSSIAKNTYPCKLVGEKISFPSNEQIILFKVLGKKNIYNAPLKGLFPDKKIISGFSPKDALKLGEIAFNEIINNVPKDEQLDKFKRMKEVMLTSTHDIYHTYNLDNSVSDNFINSTNLEIDSYLAYLIVKNSYPFKLVGYQSQDNFKETTIIYTILGKREGYKKSLKAIITTDGFLGKFHPTEAIKFGFIYAGEKFFAKR